MNLDDELKRWQAIRTVAPQAPRLGDALAQSARQAPRRGNFLSDILGGLKEKASDIANTGLNIGRTIGGSLADKQHRVDMLQRESNSKKRNDEIARKYGYSSYNDAMNDENASQAFWDEIRAGADTEMKLAKERKQKQAKSAWNVQDIDLNKAKGQGLSTVASVLDLLPGVGSNVASGALEGVGQSFKDAQGGKDVDWEQASKNALISSAGSLAGGMAGRKLGGVAGRGVLGRTASGALSGLASGATAGGLTAGLEGGDIYEGAKMGGLRGLQAGGTMAGLNALGAKALNVASGVRPDVDDVNLPKSGRKKIENATEVSEQSPSRMMEAVRRGDVGADIVDNDNTKLGSNVELRYKHEAKLDKLNASRAQDLLSQYPTISKPVARQAQPQKYVLKLAEAGIVKPEEVSGIAKRITGADGKVSKMTRSAVATAGKVKTDDLYGDGATLFNRLTDKAGLKQSDRKAFTEQIGAFFDQLGSRRGETLDGMDDAEELFRISKDLRAESAQYSGKGGTYHLPTREDLAKAKVLNGLAEELEERIYKSADLESIKTPENIAELKALSPNNKKWADYIDKNVTNAKSVGQIRSAVAPFVNMQKVIDEGELNSITAGGRGGNMFNALTSNHPIRQGFEIIANATSNSDKAKQAKYALHTKLAEAERAKLQEQLGVKPSAPRSNHQLVDLLTGIKRANAIGDPDARTNAGIKQAILEGRTFDPVDNSLAQRALATGANLASAGVSNLPRFAGRMAMQGTADDIRSGAITEEQAQAMMNEAQAMNEQQAMQEQQMPMQQPTPEAQPMGDMQEQLAMLSNAMGNALNAGDFQAYSQIAKMYGDAMDIMAMQAKLSGAGTSSGAGLSSEGQKQMAKLSSAENAINELESLYKNAGGAQGRLGGGIAELGAKIGLNSGVSGYNAMAEGLINQIAGAVGKTDALNNEGEVKRALALIPKISDTPEEAQIKLNSLRQMLKSNTQTFTDVYGR